jgi:hypothetical protein
MDQDVPTDSPPGTWGEEAVEGAASLLVEIAVALEDSLDGLGERLLDRATRELPALGPVWRLELGRPVKRGVVAALRDSLARIATHTGPPVELPADTHYAAQLWARAGLDVSVLISACFVASYSFWDEFERATRTLAPEADRALEAQKRAQRSLALYADRLQQLLRSVYNRERELLTTDLGGRRSLLVSTILAGAMPRSSELGYELAQHHHVALVAWGAGAQRRAETLAKQSGRRLLATAGPDGSIWAWLGGLEAFSSDELLGMIESDLEPGGAIALGEPGHGVDGFRRSHRQAQQARAAAALRGRPEITRYRDVALVALLQTCDATASHAFVEHALSGLLGSDRRSTELRRTLELHLANGQRTGATGEAVGIDRHTVRERLDEIERRLGTPIQPRSGELEAALLLLGAGLGAGRARRRADVPMR